MDEMKLKEYISELIIEELGPNPCEIAPKWDGGRILLEPGNETQSKEIPIDTFFRKIVGIRDALRVLEQKLNTHEKLSASEKASFQAYITKAYGSLTTFNIFFKDGKDRFVGSGKGSGSSSKKEKMTLQEAQAKLGLNEY